jgi:4,5-dihydroxyphthalate decarboxylase
MTDTVSLTVACNDFETVQPLVRGTVGADGLDLTVLTDMTVAERQHHMLHDLAFDVCELSASTYMLARERGLPITAIPVFLLRKFRHGDIYVRKGRGISTPTDLIGRKVGGLGYQVASNVWARGILAEHYGVPHDSIIWVVQRPEEIAFDPPPGLEIQLAPPGSSLDAMLLAGEIDALMAPMPPKLLLEGDKRIKRLFPNYKKVEAEYFRQTGIFPIMHVMAIKQEIVDTHPWVPATLLDAFERSKKVAYERMANLRAVPLAWFGSDWEEERKLLGIDPWAYGLGEGNMKTLEALTCYMHNQGMAHQKISVRELFYWV